MIPSPTAFCATIGKDEPTRNNLLSLLNCRSIITVIHYSFIVSNISLTSRK
jgi:hypothetical protein